MRRPIVAYPLGVLLVLGGLIVAIRWSVPGTVNGATLVLVASIVAAILLYMRVDHEPPTPRMPRVWFDQQDPRPGSFGRRGDLWYRVEPDGFVAACFRHDGRRWQPFTMKAKTGA